MSSVSFFTATNSERATLETFLKKDSLNHWHLDWGDLGDWINNQDILVQVTDNKLSGVISIPMDQKGNSWVRLCAIDRKLDYLEVGQCLFEEAIQRIPYLAGSDAIYSIALWNWYTELLQSIGFEPVQTIVTLEKKLTAQLMVHAKQLINEDFLFTEIKLEDMPAIHHLDNLAFSVPWQLSASEIFNAYQKTDYKTCIAHQNRLIAYQMSSLNGSSAHISRIAVHPSFQKRGLATTLLTQICNHYFALNTPLISVNTQSCNASSIALYKVIGFIMTHDDFPVYRKVIPTRQVLTQRTGSETTNS